MYKFPQNRLKINELQNLGEKKRTEFLFEHENSHSCKVSSPIRPKN